MNGNGSEKLSMAERRRGQKEAEAEQLGGTMQNNIRTVFHSLASLRFHIPLYKYNTLSLDEMSCFLFYNE